MEIGKYLVTRRLGGGGMGVVYEASDKTLRRQVAIKFFAEAVRVTRDAVKRFMLEAQAAARLNHPNVVSVFEVGRRDGVYFLVMELVAGGSAEERLRRHGKFDWAEATRLTAAACRGLAAAHAASLIHRDIKPANLLMVERPGGSNADRWDVKVGDFGLAKLTDGGASMATAADRVLGTPHYMSPEQCRCEALDARTDLYSLGATYFSLLTGHLPFAGESPMQVMFAHCWTPPPDPRQVDPSIPAACAAIVRRALAKDARDRYRSAGEMLVHLESALSDPTAGPEVIPAPTRNAARAAVWDAVVSQSFDPAPSIVPEMPLARHGDSQLITSPGSSPAQSRFHRRRWYKRTRLTIGLCLLVVTAAAGGAAWWIHGGNRDTAGAVNASGSNGAPVPAFSDPLWTASNGGSVSALLFSPNGRKLVAAGLDGDGGVRAWDMADGRPCMLAVAGQPCSAAAFTADPVGQTLYFGSAGSVLQWSLTQEAMRNSPLPIGGDIWSVTRSPDGRILAVVAKPPGMNQHPFIKLFDSRDKELPSPIDASRGVITAGFLGETNLLATGGTDATLRLWDVDRLTKYQGAAALVRSINTEVVIATIAASRSGKVIALGGRKSVQFVDPNGRKLGRAYGLQRNVRCLAISPDGTMAAVGSGTDTTAGTVMLYAVPGGEPICELTGHKGAVSRVAFSPDGKLLATGSTDHAVKVWEMSRLPRPVRLVTAVSAIDGK